MSNIIYKKDDRFANAQRSIVEVYFPKRNCSYSYYNDMFNLKKGDWVYVEGKLEGFCGEETAVEILFENKLVGVIYDRFGTDVTIRKHDENHFVCRVKVAVSPHFLSWIMSFGNRAKILSPDFVIDEMIKMAEEVVEVYK